MISMKKKAKIKNLEEKEHYKMLDKSLKSRNKILI